MIVFKCYMKILRQNVTLVIIYLGIFFSVALVAARLCPEAADYMIASHVSKEPAAHLVLDELGKEAVLFRSGALPGWIQDAITR